MVKQIMQVYTMHLKQGVDLTGFESLNELKTQKVTLLHQALVLSQWIDQFNTDSVQDFFKQDDAKKDVHSI